MLNRDDDNQIKITLLTLKEMNIGWCKSINAALIDYGLPNDYTQIKNMTKAMDKTSLPKDGNNEL